jgi:hypothetical protein
MILNDSKFARLWIDEESFILYFEVVCTHSDLFLFSIVLHNWFASLFDNITEAANPNHFVHL